MRYLTGTLVFGIVYGGQNNYGHTLVGFVNSDFVRDLDKRMSQAGYLFTLRGWTIS